MTLSGQENHSISFAAAAACTARFRGTINDGDCLGGFFGKDALEQLLNQDGCIGFRYYYGLDSSDKKVLILVGVDEDENDMIGEECVCLDMSTPCPTICGNKN